MVGSEWEASTWRGTSSHQGRVINVLPEQLAAVIEALCAQINSSQQQAGCGTGPRQAWYGPASSSAKQRQCSQLLLHLCFTASQVHQHSSGGKCLYQQMLIPYQTSSVFQHFVGEGLEGFATPYSRCHSQGSVADLVV